MEICLLFIYCHVTILPKTQQVEITYIYYITVSVVPKSSHGWAGSPVLEFHKAAIGYCPRLWTSEVSLGKDPLSNSCSFGKVQFLVCCWFECFSFLLPLVRGFPQLFVMCSSPTGSSQRGSLFLQSCQRRETGIIILCDIITYM